ncbi:MAG: UDP-N-acetylmuramate dehydrogenase [Desulfomonile sp.]|nr:UDP-N-acetylmuramate dehydrogenase [Desulfomonile sp.]
MTTRSAALIAEIRAIIKGRVIAKPPLSHYTSFRIGGPADVLAEPESAHELAVLIRRLHELNVPHVLLGSGTNVLFQDAGFRGVVIRTVAMKGLTIERNGADHVRITAAAGAPLPLVVGRAARDGLTGIEALCGIPGSFGGAVATNAGTGGVSLGDALVRVRLLDGRGKELVLETGDIHFSYRSMELPADATVVEGTVRLVRGDRASVRKALSAAMERRRATQPWRQPSAGCVFKNPSPDNPAGAIIDRLGLKGMSVGDAVVSEVHANFIVNRGSATASDVLALVELIRRRVKDAHDINLELEVRVIGEGPANV